MPKTTSEKIESVQEQIKQLENQKRRLIQAQKEHERKTRTKRLIERGALLESLIPDASTLSNDQIKTILVRAFRTDNARQNIASRNVVQPESASPRTVNRVNANSNVAAPDTSEWRTYTP